MKTYEFALVISGDPSTDENINRVFEAGCDDATFGSVNGTAFAQFTREASSLQSVVVEAIRQIQSVPGLRVVRIEPDDLVTAAEIAERLGVTRQAVSLFVAGERRNNARFPAPTSHLTARNRLWSWSEVVSWYKSPSSQEAAEARWVVFANNRLARGEAIDELPFVDLTHFARVLQSDHEYQRNVSHVVAGTLAYVKLTHELVRSLPQTSVWPQQEDLVQAVLHPVRRGKQCFAAAKTSTKHRVPWSIDMMVPGKGN